MQLVAQCLNKSCKNKRKYVQSRGRESVAGIVIRYKLDGPAFEPRWEKWCFFIRVHYGPELHLFSTGVCMGLLLRGLSGGAAAVITCSHLIP
jgi:hypothetical protein